MGYFSSSLSGRLFLLTFDYMSQMKELEEVEKLPGSRKIQKWYYPSTKEEPYYDDSKKVKVPRYCFIGIKDFKEREGWPIFRELHALKYLDLESIVKEGKQKRRNRKRKSGKDVFELDKYEVKGYEHGELNMEVISCADKEVKALAKAYDNAQKKIAQAEGIKLDDCFYYNEEASKFFWAQLQPQYRPLIKEFVGNLEAVFQKSEDIKMELYGHLLHPWPAYSLP